MYLSMFKVFDIYVDFASSKIIPTVQEKDYGMNELNDVTMLKFSQKCNVFTVVTA